MSTKKGFRLSDLIQSFMSRLSKQTKAEEEPPEPIDCRNPWQYNLERLAAVEHTFKLEKAAQQSEESAATDSLTSFVTDLAKKSVEAEHFNKNPRPDAKPANGKLEKRLGDKTVNDMKSWWAESLSPTETLDGQPAINSELPGKPRLLKRWFD